MIKRYYWGFALVLVGLAYVAVNAGYLEPFDFWGLWPLLIIGPALRFGLRRSFITVSNGRHRSYVRIPGGIWFRLVALWVAAGAAVELLSNVGLTTYDWGDMAYWTLPVLLAAAGILLMARPGQGWKVFAADADVHVTGDVPGDVSSFIGDLRLGATPWVFKSPMRIDVWAGDIDVDLTTAQFPEGESRLFVTGWAGDVDIRAPEGIDVLVDASCRAGRVTVFDRRREGLGVDLTAGRRAPVELPEGEARRLYVSAALTFGNIRVR